MPETNTKPPEPLLISRLRALVGLFRKGDKTAGQERNRRLALTTATGLFDRMIQIGTVMVTARLALNYLGEERYGMWMTMASTITMIGFADLGLGRGLIAAISHARGRDDDQAVREYVSSAFFVLCLLTIVFSGVFLLVHPLIPWERVFNVQSSAAVQEAGPAIGVVVACFLVGIALGIVQHLQFGFQRGYAFNLWRMSGSVVALVGVVAGVYQQASLPMLIALYSGIPRVVLAANCTWEFLIANTDLRPRFVRFRRERAKELLSIGVKFAFFPIVAALAFQCDNLIIAHVIEAEAVAAYSLNVRLFNLAALSLSLFTTGLFPAYGEAYARGDSLWITRTLKRIMLFGGIATALQLFVLILLAPWLLEVWVGKPMDSLLPLRLGLAAWVLSTAVVFQLGVFLQAAKQMRLVLAISFVEVVAGPTMKYLLASEWGVSGIPWAGVLVFLPLRIAPIIFAIRLLRRVEAGCAPTEDHFWLSRKPKESG